VSWFSDKSISSKKFSIPIIGMNVLADNLHFKRRNLFCTERWLSDDNWRQSIASLAITESLLKSLSLNITINFDSVADNAWIRKKKYIKRKGVHLKGSTSSYEYERKCQFINPLNAKKSKGEVLCQRAPRLSISPSLITFQFHSLTKQNTFLIFEMVITIM